MNMTTDPQLNILYQIKNRLLNVMGEEGEVEGKNTIYIRGITLEEWGKHSSLIEDEPNAEFELDRDGDDLGLTITVDLDEDT